MELNLVRPLLFFDIESTGLDITNDSIVELSFVKVLPGNPEPLVKTWRIKPWDYEQGIQRPMNPEASKVNGIKDEDLKDCKIFLVHAPEIVEWLKGCDLAGFNSAKFDLPMLAEEIERACKYCRNKLSDPKSEAKARETLKQIDIDLHSCMMVDVQNIYHYMEPRNLKAAHRFYCNGADFDNAHSAEADTIATFEVLKGQLDMYQTPDQYHEQALKNDVEFLSGIGGRPKGVDFACKLVRNSDGEVVVNFGKHKGRLLRDVYRTEPNYFDWVEKGEFALETKRKFSELKQSFIEEYKKKDKDLMSKPASKDQLDALANLFNNKF